MLGGSSCLGGVLDARGLHRRGDAHRSRRSRVDVLPALALEPPDLGALGQAQERDRDGLLRVVQAVRLERLPDLHQLPGAPPPGVCEELGDHVAQRVSLLDGDGRHGGRRGGRLRCRGALAPARCDAGACACGATDSGLRSALGCGSFARTSGMSSIACRMSASEASISASLPPDFILILMFLVSSGIDEHDKGAYVI